MTLSEQGVSREFLDISNKWRPNFTGVKVESTLNPAYYRLYLACWIVGKLPVL